MILYFSGTGNTKFVAEALADKLNDKLLNTADFIRSDKRLQVHSDKPFVILAPIYAWRFPRPVEELIQKCRIYGKQKRILYCYT